MTTYDSKPPHAIPLPADSGTGFHRSQTENGTFDTLCLDCLRTIAWSTDEWELVEIEKKHLCPEKALRRMLEAHQHSA